MKKFTILSSKALFPVLILCFFLTATSMAQIEDTEPPQLVNFSFAPTSVDTSTSSQDITFTWEITDDIAGLLSCCSPTQLLFKSPSGAQSQHTSVTPLNLISGSAINGIYESVLTLPQYSETGVWQIEYLMVVDEIGNSQYLYSADLTSMGFNTELTVGEITLIELVSFTAVPKGTAGRCNCPVAG